MSWTAALDVGRRKGAAEMERRQGIGASIAALVLVLVAMAGAAAEGPTGKVRTTAHGSYVDIDAATLARMLARKDFALVNVHIPYEGDIAGTDASVPFDRIGEHLDRLPQDRSARLVLYCKTGRMSTIAARELLERGYTNIVHLAGGMVAWKRAGYPIVRPDR
jgi:rhodanese-related sulfurtransferase